MRFPTILFDLDGSIIDSIELIMESYRHTMRRHRGECPPDEVFPAGILGARSAPNSLCPPGKTLSSR